MKMRLQLAEPLPAEPISLAPGFIQVVTNGIDYEKRFNALRMETVATVWLTFRLPDHPH